MHIDGKRRGNTRENTLHIPAHVRLWVEEIAALCEPDRIYWCDGTQTEWDRIATEQVARGSMVALNPEHYPNSYLARSAPNDVARTEGRTFICAASKEEAGPTNNWIAPEEGRAKMQAIFKGCMRGRTLYVVPFCMGPIEAENRVIGVQVTDSAYAVLSMRIMTRIGRDVLETLGENEFFARCIHSVGAPRSKGEPDTGWPCNDEKWILHFPESREIWSYGSGYGGNALLGKKCLALRIASVMARDQAGLPSICSFSRSHRRKTRFITSRVPFRVPVARQISPCSIPPCRDGKSRHWVMISAGCASGRWVFLRLQPGNRIFRCGPRHERKNQSQCHADHAGQQHFHQCSPDRRGHGMVERHDRYTASGSDRLAWSPMGSGFRPRHASECRFTAPIEQCPSLAEEWCRPEGVRLSAILVGGRRASAVPLVTEAFSWNMACIWARPSPRRARRPQSTISEACAAIRSR